MIFFIYLCKDKTKKRNTIKNMTEAVEKYIKKLYQLEKKAICRLANLAIWRFGDEKILKRVEKHCFKTLLQADKTVFFCVSSDEIFCI